MTVDAIPNGVSWVPFVGPRAFVEDESDRFFGRYREAHDIAALWQAHRLTILYGASGVGKTSLVNAGVVPLLETSRTDVLPVGRVSHASSFPLAALPDHNPYTFALLSAWSAAESPTRLVGMTTFDFLRRRGGRTDRYGDPIPVFIAIDQAEELFSDFAHRRAYRQPFIDDLAETLEAMPDVHLLLSIRSEFISALRPFEKILGGGSGHSFHLLPFSPDNALEAVLRPLEGTSRTFAPQAAEHLVTELQTVRIVSAVGERTEVISETIEPVQLQVVCTTLWESLPEQVREIKIEHIRRYADVDRALTDFCDQALAMVSADHDLDPDDLRQWLIDTFITELGTRSTAYEGPTQTAGMPNSVLHALEDRHLLHAEIRSNSRWFELQHDRLIQPLQQGTVRFPPARTDAAPGARALLKMAEAALVDGELALARRHAEDALRLSPEDDHQTRAECKSFLGNIALQSGDLSLAEEYYRESADLFERVQDTTAVGRLLAAIGQVLILRGDPRQSIRELRSAVARIPNDLTVQTELGAALWHNGNLRAALAVLYSVLSADGSRREALRIRSEVLADQDDVGGALRDLERLNRQLPPASRAVRAWALARQGNTATAAQELARALASAPSAAPVLYWAARTQAVLGMADEAAVLAGRALEVGDPPLPAHQRQLAHGIVELGRQA